MLDGWISSGAYGSSLTRPDSISALMSRSERSTLATYRVRYDVWANTAQPGQWRPRHGGVGVRGCSSMVERQLPKLIVRVRFPSPAPFLSSSSINFDHPFGRLLPSVVSWPSVPSIRTFSLLERNLRTELCWFGG